MSQDEAWSLSNYPVDPGAFDPPDHDGTIRLLETWKERAARHHALETVNAHRRRVIEKADVPTDFHGHHRVVASDSGETPVYP